MLEMEVALDDIDVVVEERGGVMIGGEGDVGVVDACVELLLESGREGGNGEVLKVDVAVDDSGVLVEDAGGAVVDGALLELSTTWWAPSCMPSLIARVTSMMSVAT